ncbi:hypothetical protein P153DRAFT_381770 [Dothidotthia symphoricarpi CBS 119687]|uniref:F-box domain-containing protein n=1 Tax=Dothidotthia symphoricarpi CBS 119687 TaxID=1392245 RepID=A0A6A6ANH2_9PLEO|nr:uncharacterized protein P153DRAFT_381770 [Dothidotthia symphoricarpi CBS 119687]KAF2133340.1 hypothetical protein P153DRAFT_381770 [Dothidotthia symphoricarpi CBS 119687]
MSFQPFRLMDLPAELRLQVYRSLPRQIKHTHIRVSDAPRPKTIKVILITRHIPTAILRTSRAVYMDAISAVRRLLRMFILESQPMIINVFAPSTKVLKILAAVGANYQLDKTGSDDTENLIHDPNYRPFILQATQIFTHQGRTRRLSWAMVSAHGRECTCTGRVSGIIRMNNTILNWHVWKNVEHGHSSPHIEDKGYLIVGAEEDMVLSSGRLPQKWTRSEDDRDVLAENSMDQATWVGEWLAS